MSQKLILFMGVFCLGLVGLAAYLIPVHSFSKELDQLLDENKIKESYLLLEDDEEIKADSVEYYFFKLKIQCKDESTSLSEVFTTIHLLGDSIDYRRANELKISCAKYIQHKLHNSSSGHISLALRNLKNIKSGSWYDFFLFEELKKIALKEQTVTAWNNCILFCPKSADYSNLLSERRKIYLDTSRLRLSNVSTESVVSRNPCYLPLLTKMDRVYDRAFSLDELYNPEYSKENYLAGRYIVGDFNSTDASGNCRGSFDILASNETLDEFQEFIKEMKKSNLNENDSLGVINWYEALDLEKKKAHSTAFWMWRNYYNKVERFRTSPLKRDPVITIGGTDYCIGQRLCLCEIQNDTIKLIAQFVTSSRNVAFYHGPLQDYDCQPRYYAPKCIITSRGWDNRLPYDSLDFRRDIIMGGGGRYVVRFEGKVDLPNFMNMMPHSDYPGTEVFSNGIHEFAVGGKTPGLYMGTPISLGCVRLHSYPSRFVRWWTPNKARFFISYQYKNYVQKYKGKTQQVEKNITVKR